MKNRGKQNTIKIPANADVSRPLPYSSKLIQQYNIIDILRINPSPLSFQERVERIGLSADLLAKINSVDRLNHGVPNSSRHYLSEDNEKELATEVLLTRHKFTCLVFENRFFRQAALTVIQNIYLFRQRKIFFGTPELTAEQQRQEALQLFSKSPLDGSIPLAKAFQHLILARVWHRINNQVDKTIRNSKHYNELHEVVEQLNTLRNIYMLLSLGLTHKLTRNVNSIYRQSITGEDAHQIGSFGIARAAYRYHPSTGIRFSTYASRWILKELQRQALDGRLIRISTNLVEQIAQDAKESGLSQHGAAYTKLCNATAQLTPANEHLLLDCQLPSLVNPGERLEQLEMRSLLLDAIQKTLSQKSSDVIMRRYGLGPFRGKEQSVIEIAKLYGVTRGSIYQLEQTALKKIREHISCFLSA